MIETDHLPESVDQSIEAVSVRRYLEYLANPELARDDDLIQRLGVQLAGTQDVLVRLRLLSDLERANQVDGAPLLEAFIKHARMWAATNRVSVTAFRSLGVSPSVLAQAGFDLGHGTIHEKRGKSSSSGSTTSAEPRSPRSQAPSVPSSVVKAWMLEQNDRFNIGQAMANAGGSMMTVKKAANDLVLTGQVRSLGQIAQPGTRGRAPEFFVVQRSQG